MRVTGKARKPLDQARYTKSKDEIQRSLRRSIQRRMRSGGEGRLSQSDLPRVLADAGIKSAEITVEDMKAIVDSLGAAANYLDDSAKAFSAGLRKSYYADSVDAQDITEYAAKVRETLAQDQRSFDEHLLRSSSQVQELDYEEFRETLGDDRLEASDWESMMLWLTTGAKRAPKTS